jgi:leucyl aminopeptidase
MQYSCKLGTPQAQKSQCLVIGIFQNGQPTPLGNVLDEASSGGIQRVLRRRDLSGDIGSSQMIYELDGIEAARVLLVGLGEAKSLTPTTFGLALQAAVKQLQQAGPTEATIVSPTGDSDDETYRYVRAAVDATATAVYRFDECKSDVKPPKRPLKRLTYLVAGRKQLAQAKRAIAHGQAVASGTALAKDLGNLPGNHVHPDLLGRAGPRHGRSVVVSAS